MNRLLDLFFCLVLNHPPITSIVWGGRVEQDAERTAYILAARGLDMKINCLCGKKMVDPIWWPWWRMR